MDDLLDEEERIDPEAYRSVHDSMFSLQASESAIVHERSEQERRWKKAFEVLGEQNIHGADDIALTFGIELNPEQIPPLPYTEEDLERSKHIYEATGVEEMLVLCVAEDIDHVPMTCDRIVNALDEQFYGWGLGSLMDNTLRRAERYKKESYYTDSALKLEWMLVTKSCIPNSLGRAHSLPMRVLDDMGEWEELPPIDKASKSYQNTQEYAIDCFAETCDLERSACHRPTAAQLLYAMSLHAFATNQKQGESEKILAHSFHWTDEEGRQGFVTIGGFEDGIQLGSAEWRAMARRVGVCLRRDPTST